jgi:hyperosmotically inducible periplasmic protein
MKKLYFITLFAVVTTLAAGGVSAQSNGSRTIEQQVRSKILRLPDYGVFDHITYEVNGSTVTLSGKAISLGTKSAAVRSVKRIPGVTEVINNIEDLPVSPFDNEIRMQALRTFEARGLGRYFWPNDPDVRIIVDGGRITLEGYVYNKGDRDALNIYANGISGVFGVTNNLMVGKPVA